MKEVIFTSAVLIVVLLLLRLAFAKKVRRTLIYAVWALVALRLLIPVQIGHLQFSVLTSVKPVTDMITEISDKQVAGVTAQDAYRQVLQNYIEEDISVFTPEVQKQIQSALDDEMPKEEIAVMIDKVYPEADIYVPGAQQQVQQKVEETASPITLGQIMTVVWLAGVVVMVAWLATSNLLLSRALRKSEETLVCESPIPVYVSEKASSPCLVGLFRPAVYLTPECASDEGVFRYALTHELTHYAHKDHIWALVRCICLCVYWFDPLVWVAAWFSRRDCELACDEGALKRLGEEERIAYGKALLQVVSQASVPGKLMLIATTMAETKRQLKERVTFIAKKPKWSVAAAVCMILVCLLVSGCAASGPEVTTATEESELQHSWEVSEEVQLQMKQDYLEYMSRYHCSCTIGDVSLAVISHVDSGYAMAISCKCGSVDLNASWEELFGVSAGDLMFYMPNGWFIKFYKDGDFRNLDEAYNGRWLDYEQLRTIWEDYHAQFPKALEKWQSVYSDLLEPPERDSSGLDYEVNADGVTCTITGKGVCNDYDVVIPEYIDNYQVTAIGKMAFWAEYWITSVTMPDSVVSIGISAFEDCDQLKSITLSNSLDSIGTYAFKGCKSLESINLPDSLTSIGGGVFLNCNSLTEVRIPAQVTVISAGTFRSCKNLVSLALPGGIEAIGEGAFGGCNKLIVIEYRGTKAQWQSINQVSPWYEDAVKCIINCNDGQIVEN